jgi:hypothetical protein
VVTQVDDIWHKITPSNATDKGFDIANVSTSDGANVQIYSYWGGQNQQFRFQVAGSGRWRIIARHSEKCLDVAGASTSNGANVIQYTCVSGSENQMFQMTSVSSALSNDGPSPVELSPNPASDYLNINMKYMTADGADVNIFNTTGVRVLSKYLTSDMERLDISQLAKGVYILQVVQGETIHSHKLLKE